MDFFNTVMGKRFYEGTMPRIASALEAIAKPRKVEYDLIPEESILEYSAKGWKFVAQLKSGDCLMEKEK
jgi:hypothetical protein